MRKLTSFVITVVFAMTLAPAIFAAEGSWTGWVSDAKCGVKGNNVGHKACTKKCADKGASLVFVNNADQKVYKLDKQDEAKKHMGDEVEIKGDVDGDSIKVASITDKKP